MIRRIPNILSISRVVLSLLLIPLFRQRTLFVVVYVLIAATDILDGLIARRYHSATSLGARLDSLGDFIFFGVLLILFYTWFQLLLQTFLFPIAAIAVLRLCNVILGMMKFKQLFFIHTLANKLAGCMAYCVAISLVLFDSTMFIALTFIVSIAAALEEFIIMLISKELALNRKSIFFR